MKEMIKSQTGKDLVIIGKKPDQGDKVYVIDIPNDTIALRFWESGLKGFLMMDWMDPVQGAIPTPEGYFIFPYYAGSVNGGFTSLTSWEKAFTYGKGTAASSEGRLER
ncbi:hypothetical protein GLOTRDRAFT_126043 [Gloeophyllum trabeum ATCC 11539]|uniref:Uncharacterized protein n=1 Tax=Gloeophyllum trabeum (strain ATCC 11539 / FP-39264 / Madison 617) TaxID=670483 RepID=S7QKH1_GLOTA|nr:uncharacterized protein GLOTRDRAFT_126043 [Gloeophyllum trabeum ATCC 11539]EPQ59748.1 hypothetical protein GLOTRDRAFT_126043 [Gloeophyllum trabeum ATCC 11539]